MFLPYFVAENVLIFEGEGGEVLAENWIKLVRCWRGRVISKAFLVNTFQNNLEKPKKKKYIGVKYFLRGFEFVMLTKLVEILNY